ncbi:MAG TPA: TIGR04086 family membrane protein [Candidatus Coproplasma stercoravium]|nr:TIGR04086 family membrane protein [Candidatus Coproplasma stercoravium]
MRDNVLQVLKATLAAAIFSLLCVLIFSFIIQLFSVSTDVIKPVNQVFKILAIALGGILFIRGGRGLFKGAVYGVCAVLVTYLLFSIISSSFAVTWLFALEIALGAVAGGISGIIGVNIKHRG